MTRTTRHRGALARPRAATWRGGATALVAAAAAWLAAAGAARAEGGAGAGAAHLPPQGGPSDARYATAESRARFVAEGQGDVPEEFRITDPADADFLQYIVPWTVLPDLARVRLDEAQAMQGDLALLVGEDGWTLTLKDVQDWFWARGVQLGVTEAIVAKPELFAEGVIKGSYVKLIPAEARAAGMEEAEGVEVDMRFIRERLLRPVIYHHAYEQGATKVTDQDVELEYERQKQTIFRTPMTFTIRQVFLRGYEEYVAERDDQDLREVARAITGSEAGVLQVRGAERPSRRRWMAERDRDRLAYVPVRAGERLLVPMDAGGWERLFGRALDVQRRLEAGESFEEVARTESDDPRPGEVVESADLEPYDRLLPELLEAIRTTPVGSWAGPIRSVHGIHFVEVVARQDETFTPLEEVRPQLKRVMESAAIRAAGDALMEGLRAAPEVKVREELIRATADKALLPLETVIAEYDGRPITFEDVFSSDQLRTFFTDGSAEDRLRMIRESRILNDLLMTRYASEQGFLQRPDVAGGRDYYLKFSLAKRYEAERRLEAFRETPALLYRFYRDQQEKFRQPARYDFILLQKVLPQEAAQREGLTELLERLRDEAPDAARFEELAATLSDDPELRARRGRFDGVYHFDAEHELRSRLPTTEPGTIVGPFAMRGTLNLLLLTAKEEKVVPPFEHIFQRVSPRYQEQVYESLELAEVVRKLREANVRVNPALLVEGEEEAAAPAEAPAAAPSAAIGPAPAGGAVAP